MFYIYSEAFILYFIDAQGPISSAPLTFMALLRMWPRSPRTMEPHPPPASRRTGTLLHLLGSRTRTGTPEGWRSPRCERQTRGTLTLASGHSIHRVSQSKAQGVPGVSSRNKCGPFGSAGMQSTAAQTGVTAHKRSLHTSSFPTSPTRSPV